MKLFQKIEDQFINLYDNLTNSDDSWENRVYDFYLVFGDEDESKSPWLKSNWNSNFEPYFDSLINQVETKLETGIRVNKYKPENKTSKKDNKEFIYHSKIKLGRLKWDKKSHENWTEEIDGNNHFENFELWTPIWTVCEKRDIPPDIFISISNQKSFDISNKVQFNYFIVVAIAKNLNMDSKSLMLDLSKKANTKVTILKERRWGKSEKVKKWSFVNWIQDTSSNGIYEGKNLNNLNFNEIQFEPVWEIIYKQK